MSLAERQLPLALPDRLAPQRCVLMIVDMQNDFCAAGGYIDQAIRKDVSAAAVTSWLMRGRISAAALTSLRMAWSM